MPQPEHTLGPWKWENKGFITDLVSRDGESVLWYTNDDDGLHGSEADKRLIAAAPDLLAALKLMLEGDVYADGEGMCDFAKSDTERGEAAVKAARAAIAKAEGATDATT